MTLADTYLQSNLLTRQDCHVQTKITKDEFERGGGGGIEYFTLYFFDGFY